MSEWVSFLRFVFVCIQDLACVDVFVAGGARVCVCMPSFSARAFIQPVCIHQGMCVCVSVYVCVFVFSLISSVPAGQFWHLERKTLCIPHGSTASSSELEMGL